MGTDGDMASWHRFAVAGKDGPVERAYTTKRCGDCQFWDVAPNRPDKPWATCRRFPPVIIGAPATAHWPVTMASDWCWEFKVRTETA